MIRSISANVCIHTVVTKVWAWTKKHRDKHVLYFATGTKDKGRRSEIGVLVLEMKFLLKQGRLRKRNTMINTFFISIQDG